MGVATTASGHPVWTVVCLSVAIADAMAGRPPFWTLPTEFLASRKAAAGIAAINLTPFTLSLPRHRAPAYSAAA